MIRLQLVTAFCLPTREHTTAFHQLLSCLSLLCRDLLRFLLTKRCVRVIGTKGNDLQGRSTTEASAGAVEVKGGERELLIACEAGKIDANVALGEFR